MTRRRKKLSDEDKELWSRVAATTKPLHPARPKKTEVAFSVPKPPKVTNPRLPIEHFDVGARAPTHKPPNSLASDPADHLRGQPVHMDRKTHGKMTRGKLQPEGRIDLHGKTLAQAHPALIRFILNAQSEGKRLVLVITGKGKHRDEPGPIPVKNGVLRHQVPQWLHQPPLLGCVLQITPAHQRHGGTGAYYVYLRRDR
ncbi:Smr/MutS family protein [Actibacterium pelagium]|uniref:DNA mismatch repair protein MutS n=1 Tax=Actibacterium pelagium TaxID=2029103 RepID=A0A917EM07_9RHOB|nr:Smr/MutS family protein [Actibacterium pelagium]GGE55322.1 DNA mismatch repair protein MutS [Actibacterium pelagium]